MQSTRSKFLALKQGNPSDVEKFLMKRSWAEFGLRSLTLLWLLVLFSLIVFALVIVAVRGLTVMPNGKGGIMMWAIVALLVRALSHVGKLITNSFKSLFPTQNEICCRR